ncbi:MAG: pantoate--beta-alanine ligase [Flavobacteriaceae bacterium]
MKVCYTKTEITAIVNAILQDGKTLGFVPTMGALHQGHGSLIQQSVNENQTTIVSIFVNPTQFDNNTDLTTYPRTLEEDIKLIQNIDPSIVVFAPDAKELYNNNVNSESYSFDGLEFEMEGKHRKGHFDGVGTILELLFNLIKPTNAYFGEKDFQQLQIVKKLVSKYHIDVNIIGCEIFRETSGLAMSSRNERLSEVARKEAAFIYKTLTQAKMQFGTKSAVKTEEWVTQQFAKNKHLTLEYVSVANTSTLKPVQRKSKHQKYRLFIAAFIDNIRLIDNIALN